MKVPCLSERTEKLLIATSVLISAWVAFECLLAPQCQQLAAAGRQDQIRKLYDEKIMDLQDSVELRREKLEELNRQKASLAKRFFELETASKYFSSLYDTAGRYGCRILSMDYQTLSEMPNQPNTASAENPSVQYRAARVAMTGPYEGWMDFLNHLESDARWVTISEFQITPVENRRGSLNAGVQIVIPVFCDVIPKFQYVVEEAQFEETDEDED